MTDAKNPGPIPPVPGASGGDTETGENNKNQVDAAGDAFVNIFSSVNLDEIQDGSTVSEKNTNESENPVIQKEKKEVPLSESLQQKFQEKASSVAHVMDPTIKGIDDIHAYIEQKKREKKQQTEYTKVQDGIYSADGVNLRQVPGVYAVVPHAKGDHKLVFDVAHAPADLQPDPANREKGKPYVKNGNRIYDVELKMMEHPTLKSPDGDPLDVWVIGSPEELTKQMNAIRHGKGGGTNLSDPLVVGEFSSEGEQQSHPLEAASEETTESILAESELPEIRKEQDTPSETTEPDAPEGWIHQKQEEQEESQQKQEVQEELVVEEEGVQEEAQEVHEEVQEEAQEDLPVAEALDEADQASETSDDESLSDDFSNEMPEVVDESGTQDNLQDNLASYRGGGINQDAVQQEESIEYRGGETPQSAEGEVFPNQFDDKSSQDPLFHGDLQYDLEVNSEKQTENDATSEQEAVDEQELSVNQIPEIIQGQAQEAYEVEQKSEPGEELVLESKSEPEEGLVLGSKPELELESGTQQEIEIRENSTPEMQDSSAIDLDTLSQPAEAQEDLSQESQKGVTPKSTIVKPTTIEGILDATATEGKQIVIPQPSHAKAIWVRLVILLILLSGVGVIFTTMFSLENSPLTIVRDMLGISKTQTGDVEPIIGTSGAIESTGDDTLGRGDLGTGENTGEQIPGPDDGATSGEDAGNDGTGIGGDPVEVSGADAASLYTRDELVIKLEKQQEEARDILYEASIINNETATIYAKASSLKAQQTKDKVLSPDRGALTQEDVFEIIKKIDHYLETARDAIDN